MLCLEERKLNIIPLLCVLFCDVLFVWLFHLLLLLLLFFFFGGVGGGVLTMELVYSNIFRYSEL